MAGMPMLPDTTDATTDTTDATDTKAARRRELAKGYACAVLVLLIWAAFSLVSRWGVRAGAGVDAAARLTPWDLGGLRYAVALVGGGALWAAGHGRGLPWRRSASVAALAGFGFALPAYLGFGLAPAAHGALLLAGTLPFMVAVGARLMFGDRFGRARLVSLGLLLAGLVLFGTEAYAHGSAPAGAWRGDLLFLSATACWAGYTLLMRRWAPTAAQSVVAVGLWCGVAYLPLWALVLPSNLGAAPWGEVVFQALFQGVLAVLLSLWLYTRALGALGPARVTTITALVPGLASLAAWPVLGEALGPLSLAGLALGCLAVALGVGRGPAGRR